MTILHVSVHLHPIHRPSIHLDCFNKPDSALFMPAEQNQLDYYHYYMASQRRVELWVHETDKQLRGLQDSQQSTLPAQQPGKAAEEDLSHQVDRRQQQHERSSSKRRTDDRSGSRPSSGSKKIRRVERHVKPPSRSSRRRTTSDRDITIASYLPYGVLPLLYAMTGSTALSVVAALILLAGYLWIDVDSNTKRSSSKRTPST